MSKDKSNYKKRINKGGAPKKEESDIRNPFRLRLSKNELNLLKKRHQDINNPSLKFTTFLRDILLNNEIKVHYIDKTKSELVYELSKIGNNINQIAKSLNQSNFNSQQLNDFEKLSKSIDNIYKKMYS